MFGTSGIRGIYGSEITEELAERIARIFVSVPSDQQKAGKKQNKLVIGRDIRDSGVSLFKAVESGALESGAEVIDLGIVPTPTVALATKKHNCLGMMLTASHNPPEYNGLKLIDGTKEIGKEMEREITRRYKAGDFGINWRIGESFRDTEIVADHISMIMEKIDQNTIRKKKPKIIVDCNGAASTITPYLLTELGCNVISVNASTKCFNRPSEPKKENLEYLGGLVCAAKADFAIAHDGDGDRCVIVDDMGQTLEFDVQLAMMIEHELNKNQKNKKIVSTVESSLAIREIVEKAGGKIEITPVGSTYVGDEMERCGALFGGEPCGEYIYQKGVHVPDAILAAAKFTEIFSTAGNFSAIKEKYPRSIIAREKFVSKDKTRAIEKIKKQITIKGEVRSDDGIRVDEEDGWFLIRASGTEPIVRLTAEYRTKEKLERRKNELTKIIVKLV